MKFTIQLGSTSVQWNMHEAKAGSELPRPDTTKTLLGGLLTIQKIKRGSLHLPEPDSANTNYQPIPRFIEERNQLGGKVAETSGHAATRLDAPPKPPIRSKIQQDSNVSYNIVPGSEDERQLRTEWAKRLLKLKTGISEGSKLASTIDSLVRESHSTPNFRVHLTRTMNDSEKLDPRIKSLAREMLGHYESTYRPRTKTEKFQVINELTTKFAEIDADAKKMCLPKVNEQPQARESALNLRSKVGDLSPTESKEACISLLDTVQTRLNTIDPGTGRARFEVLKARIEIAELKRSVQGMKVEDPRIDKAMATAQAMLGGLKLANPAQPAPPIQSDR